MVSKKLKKIIDDDKKYLFQNYGDRLPVCFIKGDGSYLFDQDNKKYIDFFSGIAVSSLGYSNPNLSKALYNQINKIIHTSNWFFNKEQIKAAKLISEMSFAGKTLFANSGTEANEAAIKLARRYGQSFNSPKQDAFKREIDKNTSICAIIIELVQGEGGINIANRDFILKLFDICNKNKILTIIDEIQTGIGRTGKAFAYQHYNIRPDIITLAKGLGGGIPVGAIHVRKELAKYLDKGSHGSTFGGNHLACAAVIAVLNELKKKKILNNIDRISSYIFSQLNKLKEEVDFIQDVRGLGFHIGIEINRPGMDIVKKALQRGLIINCTAEKIIRIMPPLTISFTPVKQGLDILKEIFLKEGTAS